MAQEQQKGTSWKKIGLWLVIGFFGLAFIGSLLDTGDTGSEQPAGQVASEANAGEAETPTPEPEPIRISITELQDRYDRNQVSADADLQGELVHITGAYVDNITGSGQVTIYNGEPLSFWAVSVRGLGEDVVMNLERGQAVEVIGENRGMSFGRVTIRDAEIVAPESES